MKLKHGLILCAASTALVFGGAALAHKGATGVVKDRMEMMKEMAKAMKLIAPMMQGTAEYKASRVKAAAGIIKKHADHLPMIFPKGSNTSPSEASEKIWTDWDGFEKSAKILRVYAAALEVNADKTGGTTTTAPSGSKQGAEQPTKAAETRGSNNAEQQTKATEQPTKATETRGSNNAEQQTKAAEQPTKAAETRGSNNAEQETKAEEPRGSGAEQTATSEPRGSHDGTMGHGTHTTEGLPNQEHLAMMTPQQLFAEIAQTCKGCHQGYRVKQQ